MGPSERPQNRSDSKPARLQTGPTPNRPDSKPARLTASRNSPRRILCPLQINDSNRKDTMFTDLDAVKSPKSDSRLDPHVNLMSDQVS